MTLSCDIKENKHALNINDSHITFGDSVILLGLGNDYKLKFEKHISTLCRKASRQLNATEFRMK